jgi:hypothetical protein
MNNILEYGINPGRFQPIGDFGFGFYCADKVRTAGGGGALKESKGTPETLRIIP